MKASYEVGVHVTRDVGHRTGSTSAGASHVHPENCVVRSSRGRHHERIISAHSRNPPHCMLVSWILGNPCDSERGTRSVHCLESHFGVV